MNSQVVGFTYRLREPDRVPGRHSSPPLYSGCSVKDYADSNFVAYLLLLRSDRSIESPLSAVPKGAGGDGILSPSILLFEMNSQAEVLSHPYPLFRKEQEETGSFHLLSYCLKRSVRRILGHSALRSVKWRSSKKKKKKEKARLSLGNRRLECFNGVKKVGRRGSSSNSLQYKVPSATALKRFVLMVE
ncbi:hypothetical protein IEQ34_016271 [Dendrobium chrysotoxum]|uniref:Uncharacterized protein n=1 Tax=Dendrobium chrysotoxum TaxID=161865 RepID=A0AAV7GDV2_DENCH|nr:hypothetical protein IEQ34_016271 [Dendrobium chrysotoxum]